MRARANRLMSKLLDVKYSLHNTKRQTKMPTQFRTLLDAYEDHEGSQVSHRSYTLLTVFYQST